MFDHMSLGVSNLAQSLAFYDPTLKPLGINQMFVMSDLASRGAARSRYGSL